MDKFKLLELKKQGFSDARIAKLINKTEKEIRNMRITQGVRPVFKRVDTCAGEFESATSYMYSTYEGDGFNKPECEAKPSDRKKVIILGGGPNRIGQGIEFDYCCVHAAMALREMSIETIMVNCNPETVSTDYDTSDRLYFEPLTTEHVFEIISKERENGELLGVIVQFGGQTPLKLASFLQSEEIPIIGTSPDAIDLAEDRERFKDLLIKLNLKQPVNAICHSESEVMEQADNVGFPLVVRPSYVLGGRAMAIIHDKGALQNYVTDLVKHFGDGPILLDNYLKDATEVDVDSLSDGSNVKVVGIMEHIEEAGIHSGDSACTLPPYSLSKDMIQQITEQTIALAKELKVIGLMNVQFAVKDGDLYILEVNPRASRTVPFVAKARGIPLAKIAAQIMAGKKLSDFTIPDAMPKHISVKEAVFPFARFSGVDIILGPEMKSTGEVMGIDSDFGRAYAKAHLGSGSTLPESGTVFVSVRDSDKKSIESAVAKLLEMGFAVVATRGTAEYLNSKGLNVGMVNKVREGRPHIVDMLKDNQIALVLNTTEGKQSISDSFSIRRTALQNKIAYSTTIAGAKALVSAIEARKSSAGLEVKAIQEYS